MKRILLSISLLLPFTICFSQVTITMEESNGIYKIPCSVNGVKMKFIFDTGASVVSLSQSMAEYMFDNGFLNKNDITGTAKTQIADGSLIDVVTVNLRDFEVGGFHLSNVLATIKSGQDVPLLMGQSAIEKLGKVSLSGNKLIIHKPKVKLTSEEIASLRKRIGMLYKAQKWEEVVEKSAQLKDATILNELDYYYYIDALGIIWVHDYYTINREICQQILSLCEDWEAAKIKTSNKVASSIYQRKAHCLTCVLPLDSDQYLLDQNNRKAIEYYKKALKVCSQEEKASIYSSIAGIDNLLEYYDSAISNIKLAISERLRTIHKSTDDVIDRKVDDQLLGLYYWQLSWFFENINDYSQRDFYIRLSAKCGTQEAIDFCFKNNINFMK